MWSEWIRTTEKMELKIFPRLAAYAEVGWTNKNMKDFDRFLESLSDMEKRWGLQGISYYKE